MKNFWIDWGDSNGLSQLWRQSCCKKRYYDIVSTTGRSWSISLEIVHDCNGPLKAQKRWDKWRREQKGYLSKRTWSRDRRITIHEDKVHPVGDTKNDKQPTIIKFISQSFLKNVFLKHILNKKNEITRRKQNPKHKSKIQQKVQPSLSRFRSELLKKANEAIKDNANFKFAYADMQGNLKFILNNCLNRRLLCD